MINNDQISKHAQKLFTSLLIKEVISDDLWNIYAIRPNREDLGEERDLYLEIVSSIEKLNPNMVSKQLIANVLLHDICSRFLYYLGKVPITVFKDELSDKITKLTEYHAIREIDVPLVNIDINSNTYIFSDVQFMKMTEEDYSDQWGAISTSVLGQHREEVLCYARVNMGGDVGISINNTVSYIRTILLTIRGLLYNFSNIFQPQIGILNDFSSYGSKLLRIHEPKENFLIEHHSTNVTLLGSNQNAINIEESLKQLSPNYIKTVDSLLLLKNRDSLSNIRNRVMSCLLWLGESTLPDATHIKFIKATTAVEALLGGNDIKSPFATQGSISETISERSAFLMNDSPEVRERVYSEIKKYYKKRSDIVHGRSLIIDYEEYALFAAIVRELAFKYINILDYIKSDEDLQKWFLSKRWESKHEI